MAHVRMTQRELDSLTQKADAFGMSKSALLRFLASIPIEKIEEFMPDDASKTPEHVLVFDRVALRKIERQLRAYGYHYNGCLHGINALKQHSNFSNYDLDQKLNKCLEELEVVQEGTLEIRKMFNEIRDVILIANAD
jgi:hypothetical protein